MSYRIRPSSKNSQQSEQMPDRSMLELQMPRPYQLYQTGPELRQFSNRLENMQSSLSSLQDLFRREREISNAGYLDVQKKLDHLEYKTFTNEKDVKQLNALCVERKNSDGYSPIPDPQHTFSRNEVSILKQNVAQDRESQRHHLKHLNDTIEQMGRKQMKLEQQLREVMAQQRQQYDGRLSDKFQEVRASESLKQQKMDTQYEMMKNMVAKAEKNIYTELQRKLRSETAMRDYIDDKISELRQEVVVEEKGALSQHSKLARETKHSIESIFDLVNNVQKELTGQLNQTQKVAADNFKKLSMAVEIVRDQLTDQVSEVMKQSNSVQSEVTELQSFLKQKLQENRQMMLQAKQQAMQYQAARVHKSQASQADSSDRTIRQQFDNWRNATEHKNLRVFRQISGALKTMKVSWKKENEEVKAILTTHEQSLDSVSRSVASEIRRSVQAIVTIFNNQFDVLAQEFEAIIEMVAVSKKETENMCQEQRKALKAEMLKQIKQLRKSSEKQQALAMQRSLIRRDQSLKNHIEQENKLISDSFSQRHTSLQNQVNNIFTSTKKHNANTAHQLQEFTLKLKTFNENYKDYLEQQRKDSMKSRAELEDSMRKNASNLTDLCYKKCEFLVDGMKKAIEMNQLKDKVTLEHQLATLKQDNEARQQIQQDLSQQINKIAEQAQNNEEAFDAELNSLKKTLAIEIGNHKLQLDEKVDELTAGLDEVKANQSVEELEAAVKAAQEAIWKIEARSFTEQAKNKAVMDRMGEDISDLSMNLNTMANELKAQ